MQIPDFSDLRSPDPSGTHEIPLNGAVYYVVADPPAEVVLASMGGSLSTELAAALASVNGNGNASLEELAQKNPVAAMQLAQTGLTQTERAIAFLQAVLVPESARRWAAAMKPSPQFVPCDEHDARRVPDTDPPQRAATDAEHAEHQRTAISLRQCMAVYQHLLAVYSGRPTVPPSSSQPGHGGTGGTSTAGAPAGGSTP